MRASHLLAPAFLSVAVAATVAAQSPAPSATPAPQMTVDSAARTVTFDLIAGATTENGSLNFNGYKSGQLTFTAPRGWTVVFEFVNRDRNLPHSAQVISATRPPMRAAPLAFPGATSTDPEAGVPSTHPMEPIRFVATTAGQYMVFCAVPGHGMAGMWVKLVVADGATPSISAAR
jgi:sulfocyanin